MQVALLYRYNKVFLLIAMVVCVSGPILNLMVRLLDHAVNYQKLPFSQLSSPGIKVRNYMCGEPSLQAKHRKLARENIIATGLRPSMALRAKHSINLNISPTVGSRQLYSIGILMTTSGLMYQGHAKVVLNDNLGNSYTDSFALTDVEDNRYNFFKVAANSYLRAEVASLGGEGIRVWFKADKACTVYRYEDGDIFTEGCPLPIE